LALSKRQSGNFKHFTAPSASDPVMIGVFTYTKPFLENIVTAYGKTRTHSHNRTKHIGTELLNLHLKSKLGLFLVVLNFSASESPRISSLAT
jgi:hypothetical protein